MKIVTTLFLFISMLCAFLLGLTKPQPTTPQAETETAPRSAPAAAEIPYDRLIGEGAVAHFKRDYTSVIYYGANGEKTEIAPEDPRLIRMFNLMGMSFDDNSMGYTQGLLDRESFERIYTPQKVRLECAFISDATGDPAKYVFMENKMLDISYQDEYYYTQEQGIPRAVEYYPYFMNFPYNILTYCGF